MELSPIEHRIEEDNVHGGFYIIQDGEQLAEMTYRMEGQNVMAILHTGVRDALRGQGVAGKLLEAALTHVRNNQLTVRPICSYVAGVFDKRPELASLRAE